MYTPGRFYRDMYVKLSVLICLVCNINLLFLFFPPQVESVMLNLAHYFCFYQQVELRRELHMDEDLPAVLLMGGGEGMGPIEATARALGDTLYDENLGEPIGQILVICGRNKKLANKLQSINWKIPVQVS